MKLLIFAHTPPPHHGQSYMVQLMLEGLGGDCRKAGWDASGSPHQIECYHVNTRFSRRLEDIGDFRPGKLFLVLFYCLKAIWIRFRHGVETFYYVPAPGKHSALYRDWVVLFICRRFFKRVILHWHAAGLGKWLETCTRIRTRAITYRAAGQVDLSVVLSHYNRADAEKLFPHRIQVVNNGIPDPCPDYVRNLAPRRTARAQLRARLLAGESLSAAELRSAGDNPHILRVLYLAHCTREKGLFDAIAGVLLANQELARQRSPITLRLEVAGNFVMREEKADFERILAQPEAAQTIHYLGFVSGEGKEQALREADLFCFPTYYENENQPVNLIEAMAFGLPVITTRWRSLPEMFPPDYPGLVDTRAPGQIAQAARRLMVVENGEALREIFLQRFTLDRYLASLAEAFHELDRTPVGEGIGVPVAEIIRR